MRLFDKLAAVDRIIPLYAIRIIEYTFENDFAIDVLASFGSVRNVGVRTSRLVRHERCERPT
jgi:hypothetical protein